MKRDEDPPAQSQVLLYSTEDGRQRIQVRLEEGTVWLSQKLMAELFQTSAANINIHLKNIFAEGELGPEAVVKESLITARDDKRYRTKLYRLEVIIAVGYRVKSHRGTQFRQWATERLREYIIKGFALDDERLSEPGGMDYFDELLERIRAIRLSEKRFYQKIRDIYTLSYDYDPQHPDSQEFFATVQNKVLFASTGMTAAEIIADRANAALNNMGLKSWKGAGRGRHLTKADTIVAKNYLDEEEMRTLELLVGQYLDFAELQAHQGRVMHMADWRAKLDDFLRLNNQEILTHAGRISAKIAQEIAHAQYEAFDNNRRHIEAAESDEELRRTIKRLTDKAGDA